MLRIRTRPVLLASLAAGLALPHLAAAQMPSFSITNIDWLQNQGFDGQGIWIGQMERGIAAQHTSYADRIASQDAGGATTLHATHVAGIMVSSGTEYGGRDVSGIADHSRLVSSYADSGVAGGSSAHFAAGMDYLVGRPIELINISWGGRATTDPNAISRAADWAAASRGKLVVVAAGNNSTAGAAGAINYPADGYNVLTVGATGFGGSAAVTPDYRRLATYSSVGPTVGATASGRSKPDLVAPGSYIFSASNIDHNGDTILNDFHNSDFPNAAGANTNPVSGTSFAAPHVSGAAALLMESARAQTWAKQAVDPLTMRAVLINGASKNVYDRANSRWDANWQARQAANNTATPLDPQLGSGLLDARRSYEILQGGYQPASSYTTTSGGGGSYSYTMPIVAWGRSSIDAGWTKEYTPTSDYRKGTYITATLTTQRETTGASAGAAAYSRPLGNLDLAIERFRNDNHSPRIDRLALSNSTRDSVEHIVYKTTDRGEYEFDVINNSANTENYAIAWHGYAAPTQVRDFNGDFMGDRGALNDNGWYDKSSLLASSAVTRAPFAANPTSDAAFAMQLTPTLPLITTARMAQELVSPVQGLLLAFDLGFTTNFAGSLRITLDGLDLLSLAGIGGGSISPQAGVNIDRFQRYTLNLTNPAFFANLAGPFSELTFAASGSGGSAFVDNVTYIPDPGPLALTVLGMLIAARRRRA